ncbi:MAG: YbfB/YjiJ family MFS transporter [Spirochaetes bacterium]|nr:YbfB/YjiJ family MFS transporter [Spirochaetota bacterium]
MNSKSRFHYGYAILAVGVATVTGALGFARFGYTMILPGMKAGLGLTDAQAGDLAMANMIGYLVLAMACGFLSAHFSPRKIITSFMLLVSASMLITGLASGFGSAFIGRLLAGMGGGGTNIPVMGLVVGWFAMSRRGLAAGITVSGSSFGLLITGLTVPLIMKAGGVEGWRHSWFFLSALSLAIALLCGIFLRDTPSEKGLAPVGAAGGSTAPAAAPGSYSLVESWRLVYRSFSVWHLAVIYVLFGFSYIIYATFFVRYLNWEAGFSLEMAGGLWSLIGVISIVSGFIWGSVSDRFGRKCGLAIVFFLQCACYMIFGLWKGMPGHLISSLIFALTAWSIPAIMAAVSGDILGPKLAPAALGFITLFFGIGQALAPFVAGRIADSYGSYTLAFVIAGMASCAGGLLSLLLDGKKLSRAHD